MGLGTDNIADEVMKSISDKICFKKSHILIFIILVGLFAFVFISTLNQRTAKSLSSRASAPNDQTNLLEEKLPPPDKADCRQPGELCCLGNTCDGYYYNVVCNKSSGRCEQNTTNQCGGENEQCCDLKVYGMGEGSAKCYGDTVCQVRYLNESHKWYGSGDSNNKLGAGYSMTCVSHKAAGLVLNKYKDPSHLAIKVLRKYKDKVVGESYADITSSDVEKFLLPLEVNLSGLNLNLQSTTFIGEKYQFEYTCFKHEPYQSVESDKSFIEVKCPSYTLPATYSFAARVRIFGSKDSTSSILVNSSAQITLVEPIQVPTISPNISCGNLGRGRVSLKPDFINTSLNEGNIAKYCQDNYPDYKPCTTLVTNYGPHNQTLKAYSCGKAE